MERCWHGKFSGTDQCLGEGRYGNPGNRGRADPKHKSSRELRCRLGSNGARQRSHPPLRSHGEQDQRHQIEGARPPGIDAHIVLHVNEGRIFPGLGSDD